MFRRMFKRIFRALTIGAVTLVVTTIAPLGAIAVVTLTATTAAASWVVDGIIK